MLTRKDEELIALLKLNARESVAALARKLGVSRTTVQDRLKRLEDNGTIKGYTVKLSDQSGEGGISAHVSLEVEPRRAVEVTAALAAIPQITALFTVSGRFDIVAIASTRSAADMDRLLDEIGQVSGITRTDTSIILSTRLDRR